MIHSYSVYCDGLVLHRDLKFPFVKGWLTNEQEDEAKKHIAKEHLMSPYGIKMHRNTPRFKRENEVDFWG